MNSQRTRFMLAVALVAVCLAPAASQAITPYSQDFEALVQTDISALGNDGWVVYGNVYDPLGNWLYGYGTFPAPNNGLAFCQITTGEGGVDQGLQQLAVFSDYENADHANGNTVEANVFQDQTISAADVGTVWKFDFNAKLGNLTGSSTAFAFIKTLDPTAGYATTNLITVDMTTAPIDWAGFSLSLPIDAGLENQLIQFGFSSSATLYESSGVFYDNIVWAIDDLSAVPQGRLAGVEMGQNYPNPFNPSTRIDFSLEQAGTVQLTVYDVAGRKVSTLHQGNLGAGDHQVTWNGQTDAGQAAPTGRYSYVLRTASGQIVRSMTLLK